MKTPSNKRFKLMCLALMVSLLLTGCALLPTTISDLVTGADDTVTISRAEYDRLQRYAELDEIWQIVEQYYYQDPDTEAMLDGAEMGLLYGLGDPYTYYYTPDQYAQLWADDEGEYAGIGIQIMGDYTTGLCTISRVFLDSPALDAGLRKGDVLTRVEDIDVVTTTLQDAVNIMRGEPGTPVNVQVQRGDQLLDFVVQRAVVHVNWVNSCMLDGDVGYISLYEFSGDCSPSFAVHLDNLMNQGAKALVIDLRDNPGGWVDDAQKVADMFLEEGNVASLVYRDGTTELYTTGQRDPGRRPAGPGPRHHRGYADLRQGRGAVRAARGHPRRGHAADRSAVLYPQRQRGPQGGHHARY